MKRVYPQGYTLFVMREDVESLHANSLSPEEGEALIQTALQGTVNSAVMDIIMAGFKAKGDQNRINIVRSTLRDYFKANPNITQIVVSISASQNAGEGIRSTKSFRPTTATVRVPSKTTYGLQYDLTIEADGRASACSCPNYTHVQGPNGKSCKHMNEYNRYQ